MKSNRQNAIIDIIENNDIETQEELIGLLSERGFNVTQATVSRDIRELKLIKVTGELGKYKYIVPQTGTEDNQHVYVAAFAASVKSVDCDEPRDNQNVSRTCKRRCCKPRFSGYS